MQPNALQIVAISYLICAAAFLFITLLVTVSAARSWAKGLLVAAGGVSALWAATVAGQGLLPYDSALINPARAAAAVTEVLRNVAWLAFLAGLLALNRADGLSGRFKWLIAAVVGLPAAMVLAAPLMQIGGNPEAAHYITGFAYLSFAISGLVLLENLFRNAGEDARFAIKFLCFGLGGLFIYDFFLYADALLFGGIDNALHAARGVVNVLTVPLIAIAVARARDWSVEIHISRQFVFHSATFIGAGIYLLVMTAVAFYLRNVGGHWGPVLQIVFFSGAVLILAVIFSSGAARARVKVFINKNFFSYKYDYRQEWLRFIHTLSADNPAGRHVGIAPAGPAAARLADRIVRAVANIVDSPAGALWTLREADNAYFPTAEWNLPVAATALPAASPMVQFLRETQWIIDLEQFAARPASHPGLHLPDWLQTLPKAWLVVPLLHNGVLRAFLLLAAPRAARALNWEDFDLLKTAGLQAASYLAEEEGAGALLEAQQFDEFNRRFAFVIHDIKNLTSQLSLMLKNAEIHGDNPDFQRDMLATVGNSVTRMQSLLTQLTRPDAGAGFLADGADTADAGPRFSEDATDTEDDTPTPTEPSTTVQNPAPAGPERWGRLGENVRADPAAFAAAVGDYFDGRAEDAATLERVLDHLMQNAVEAAGADGRVTLTARRTAAALLVEVGDTGPGMTPEFIRDQLFRPLETTKAAGFGLGAYQTRELVRGLGGRLEVQSSPGAGTVMTVVLPLGGAATSESDSATASDGLYARRKAP